MISQHRTFAHGHCFELHPGKCIVFLFLIFDVYIVRKHAFPCGPLIRVGMVEE